MLPLDSPFWSCLSHAYGTAEDIPDLLRQLNDLPPRDDYKSEPYYSLWSALCHQGDVYTASYAAVPHLVALLKHHPTRAHWSIFGLVASIEVARATDNGPDIPSNLSKSYFATLAEIPQIAAEAAKAPWDEIRCRVLISAIAVVKGHAKLSEAISELGPDTIEKLLGEWRFL